MASLKIRILSLHHQSMQSIGSVRIEEENGDTYTASILAHRNSVGPGGPIVEICFPSEHSAYLDRYGEGLGMAIRSAVLANCPPPDRFDPLQPRDQRTTWPHRP
jgi:hypothetical protein